MNYKIINGAIEIGSETIIEEINFEIKNKEKIAVIGRNGAGKTTFLKAIIDNSMLSQGIGEESFNIIKEGNPQIGYLKQIDFEDENISMLEEILKVYTPIIEIERKMERLLKTMEEDKSEETAKEYSKTLDRYEFMGGYTYKKEYETAIDKFKFSKEDRNKKISEFSGGQRTKIAFIKLLLSKPDILLLDEPTNHLDIETIEWLESYLKSYPNACVIVSHDRMFLNKIVGTVYEIEYGTMIKYTGNYTDYERQKKVNYETQLKNYEFQQKEIKRLTAIADRFRYKPTKAKMALSKLKQVERMVKLEEPNKYDLTTFKTNFKVEKETGKNVLHVKDLNIGYTEAIQNVTFDLYKGQKLGIIGENGIGKSTLLKTIVNQIHKLSGDIEFGTNVEIGYFDQQLAMTSSEKTVLEEFSDCFPKLTTTQLRSSLASFMFYGEDVFKKVSMLSGGEKVRLNLCKTLKQGPNLLILDEPTNHMDIIGKESLEMLLKEYNGTIIFVSHDRFFVNKIADSLLIFKKDGVEYFSGTYDEYEEKRKNANLGIEQKANSNLNIAKKKDTAENDYFKNKERNKITNRIKKIESQIEEFEVKQEELKKQLNNPEISTDYTKLTEIQTEIDEINLKIENLMIEWEELNKN